MIRIFYLFCLVAFITIIGCSMSVSGDKNALYERDESVYEDTLFFMQYDEQNLQIFYDEEERKLVVASYISIPKENFDNLEKMCFILDEDTKMLDFQINGKKGVLEEIYSFNQNNFNLPIEYKEVKRIMFLGNIWRFQVTDEILENTTNKVRVFVKYSLSVQSKGEAFERKKDRFKLNGNMFWYPSTLIDGGLVKLNLDIRDYYDVTANGKKMSFERLKNYKGYTHIIQNYAEEPLTLEGTKTEK